MIFRPYQDRAIVRGCHALKEHGNTLIVAPTGAGKTIMLAGLAGAMDAEKALIIQHRDELTSQNLKKFSRVNPHWPLSRFYSVDKSWRGRAVFGMVQTLARPKNLETIPNVGLAIIDECHHVAAASYLNIIAAIRAISPACMIAGFTATPLRADKKGLRKVFNNCADRITIRELIDLGFLVPPRAFVIDVGVTNELRGVRKLASDFDPAEVEAIMNRKVINSEVVKNWKEKAGRRKTIVFCSTRQHAEDVKDAFRAAGVSAAT